MACRVWYLCWNLTIIAASKASGEALTSNDPKIEDIVALYALISRMRVRSSPQIVACADNVMRVMFDTYFAPNKTISDESVLHPSQTLEK
jgi:hypothetical protein